MASLRAALLFGLLTSMASDASHASEWFMKIDGVPGTVTEGRFTGWTSIQSAGALVCLPVNPTNGAPGPVSFSCEVRKGFDSISPWLLQSCSQGETNRRVSLACVLTQPAAAIYRITLDNVLVTSVAQERAGTPTGPREKEVVRFTFNQIEAACLDLDTHGGTTGGLTALFDKTTGQGSLKTRPPFRVSITRQGDLPGLLITWPAERGHRYQIRSRATVVEPWSKLAEITAAADGQLSHFLPVAAPALFMSVEEID